MDSSWICIVCLAAFCIVTVSSDCGPNGCGNRRGGSRAGFGGYSSFSRSSNFQNPGFVRTAARSEQRSGPGWQATYNLNADGSWSRQSSWNSNDGYSNSKAALSGFQTRGGNVGGGAAGGRRMVQEVVRTGGGGGRGGGSSVTTSGGVRTGGGTTSVIRETTGGGRGGASVTTGGVRTGGGTTSVTQTKRVGGRRGGSQRRGGGARGGATRVVTTTSCEDTMSGTRYITGFNDRVQVSSCNDIVQNYPSLCSMMGSIGGDCCRSCRSIGKPNCLDQLSEANQITFGNGVLISSCKELASKYMGLCSTYGGPGSLCCHSCSGVQVDTITEEKGGLAEVVVVDEEEVDLGAKGPIGPSVQVGVSGGEVGVILPKGPTDEAGFGGIDEVQVKGPTNGGARGRVDLIVTREKGPIDEVRTRVDEVQPKGPVEPVRQRPGQMEKGPYAAGGGQVQVNVCEDRPLSRMQSKGPGITCADFVARDPCNCEEVAEECCASCSRVDLNSANCMCRDTLSAAFPYLVFVSGRSAKLNMKAGVSPENAQVEPRRLEITSCTELMQRFPSFCAQIGGAGQACCRSCRTADIRPAQTCVDRLSEDRPILLSNNDTISDCRILRRDYTKFCEDYGGLGGDCCHSCKGVDLSCVDEPLRWWRVNNGQMKNCREFVHADPCNCQKVASHCCQSCRNVDLSRCQCRDRLSAETPYVVRNINEKGDVARRSVTSCQEIARDYPEACSRLGGDGGACCRSCGQVDKETITCKDTLSSSHSISLSTGFTAYSCPRLLEYNLTLCGRPFIGGENGTCCFSCRHESEQLGTPPDECVDVSGKRWFGGGGTQRYTCKQWVNMDPCHCKRSELECCHSCQTTNQCVDRLPTVVAQALGVDSCPSLVQKYPEMCVDVASACCASCRDQDSNTVPQNNIIVGEIDKQPVAGYDGDADDRVEFKGPIMEMKSEVLEATMKNLANEIHGSVNFGVDDLIRRKVTFVDENGPVEQPEVLEWEEEYFNGPQGPLDEDQGPVELSGVEDEVINVVPIHSEDDVYDDADETLLDYYDYGGPKGDRETMVVEEEETDAGACVDKEMGKMQSKGPGITCQDFIARDPCFCEEVKEECCASCAGVVLTPERCSCRDLLSPVYPYYVYPNGLQAHNAEETKLRFESCYELISRYPNFCDDLGKSGQSCCHMCRRAHIEPNCMDKLSPQYPLYLNGRPVDDCRLLARDYKDQCLSYGGQGQACCRSCQNVGDLSCVDDSLMYWELDGTRYNCRDYVYMDPCRCMQVSDNCCDTCKQVDTRRCHCQDTLSARNPYYVQHYRPDGSQDYRETVTSCSIITRDYPQFCRELGGQRNTCCRSCLTLSHLQSKGPTG